MSDSNGNQSPAATAEGPVTLRPGLLVSLSVEAAGGVEYIHADVPAPAAASVVSDEAAVETADVRKWETTKVVEDARERAAAEKVRSQCRQVVARICVLTPFGLLCPQARAGELDEAIAEARRIADVFNQTAVRTKVWVWVLRGAIVDSDPEAIRGVAAEMGRLLSAMDEGVAERDAEKIREAASRARALSGMLDDQSGELVTGALKAARQAAREIAKAARERGEAALSVIEVEADTSALRRARAVFLDVVAPQAVETEVGSQVAGADVDLGGAEFAMEPLSEVDDLTVSAAVEESSVEVIDPNGIDLF